MEGGGRLEDGWRRRRTCAGAEEVEQRRQLGGVAGAWCGQQVAADLAFTLLPALAKVAEVATALRLLRGGGGCEEGKLSRGGRARAAEAVL